MTGLIIKSFSSAVRNLSTANDIHVMVISYVWYSLTEMSMMTCRPCVQLASWVAWLQLTQPSHCISVQLILHYVTVWWLFCQTSTSNVFYLSVWPCVRPFVTKFVITIFWKQITSFDAIFPKWSEGKSVRDQHGGQWSRSHEWSEGKSMRDQHWGQWSRSHKWSEGKSMRDQHGGQWSRSHKWSEHERSTWRSVIKITQVVWG